MARIGLGSDWECTFANDWCDKKAAAYRSYLGGSELRVCSVADLLPSDLPGTPSLVWGSFPCQDLSLAGNGAGLTGERSGAFTPLWKLMRGMIAGGRVPQIIALENVAASLCANMTETSCVTAISEQGGKENQHGNDERFCSTRCRCDGSI